MSGIITETTKRIVFVNDAGVRMVIEAKRAGASSTVSVTITEKGDGPPNDPGEVRAKFEADSSAEFFDAVTKIGREVLP